MTYSEFKKKHKGKYCDFDGSYGSQCWDLAQFYFTECLGLSSSILAGCGLVSNMLKEPKRSVLLKYFDEVKKSDIKQGDVVIWNYGHIAIYDSKKKNTNYYFSQNPNKPDVITIKNDIYSVFRKKAEKKKEEKKEDKKVNKNTYTCKYNMYVRTNAGTQYSIKLVKQLTEDGKKNATSNNPNALAVYKKGTVFTALQIITNSKGTWAKTPSGYVCIKGASGTIYCE